MTTEPPDYIGTRALARSSLKDAVKWNRRWLPMDVQAAQVKRRLCG